MIQIKIILYNYIDNEKLVKKNISNNIIDNNAVEENEKLIEDKNKYESALENINKIQKKIIILANDLDKKKICFKRNRKRFFNNYILCKEESKYFYYDFINII